MSFRKKVKKNTPRVELHSIMSLIVGSYKTGKTRLWKEVTELHYADPDDVLLMAFEDGYETWELENIVPLHKEGTDQDLWKVWEYFKKEVVPELVKEAKEGRVTKLIGIDTADRAIDACTSWIIRDRNRKYGKQFASLQDITESTNGRENGWTSLFEELKKPFDTLKNAGYGIMALAWTKEKETTLHNGLKYNSIQLAMSNSGRKVFESQASLICCLHNEVTVRDKEGNVLEDNLQDKRGREKASNFHETKTVMYFRPSEYIEIAGGRYTNLPEKVDYSAENFLKVFENAVLGQLKKTDKTVEQLKKDEESKREETTKKYVETLENNSETFLNDITAIVSKMDNDKKKVLATRFKEEFGFIDYKKLDEIDELKKALEIAQSV